MYRLYFENDLVYVRDRTEEQVSTYRARLDQKAEAMDELRQENDMLRNLVKRVKERIDLGYIEQPMPAQLTNRGAERFQRHYFGSKAILVSGDTLNDSSLIQNS